MDVEVLDTQIIHKSGCYMRMRRWLKGIHPERGLISMGWSGWETIEERDVICPIHTFNIKENDVTQSISVTRIITTAWSFGPARNST